MTNDDAHSALVRWLAARSGVTVIKTHQAGPAPKDAYIAVNMTTVREVRHHAAHIAYEGDADVAAAPVIETEWQFSCHAYGQSPTDILRPIRSAIQLWSGQEYLLPGLEVHECSQIRNVPEWLNEQWEPRAQMDVFMRGFVADHIAIDVIEEAPITFGRKQ